MVASSSRLVDRRSANRVSNRRRSAGRIGPQVVLVGLPRRPNRQVHLVGTPERHEGLDGTGRRIDVLVDPAAAGQQVLVADDEAGRGQQLGRGFVSGEVDGGTGTESRLGSWGEGHSRRMTPVDDVDDITYKKITDLDDSGQDEERRR